MVQKAMRKPTATDRLKKSLSQNTELYNLNRIRKSPVTFSVGSLSNFGGSAAGSTAAAGKYLNADGDVMSGVIAFNPSLAAVDSDGHIDITPVSTGIRTDTSYVLVTGSGTPDDLNFIDGAQYNGQYLVLQGTSTQVLNLIHASLNSISNIVGTGVDNIITVTTSAVHGLSTGAKVNILGTTNFDVQNKSITVTSTTIYTYDLGSTGSATPETSGTSQSGNIVTPDGEDFQLDATVAINAIPAVTLIFDVTTLGNGSWRIVNNVGTGSGGGGATFPLDYSVDDQGDKSGTVTHSLTATTAHKLQFTATGDCDITITGFGSGNANAVDWYIEVTQDGTGGHAITVNDAEWIDFPTFSTAAGTVSLISCHADGDGNMRAITLLNAAPTSGNFASKELDNLGTTSINASLLVDTNSAYNLGSNSNAWADVYTEVLTIPVGGAITSTRNEIIANLGGMVFNTPLGDRYEWGFAGAAATWEMTTSQLTGQNIILSEVLVINDNSLDPVSNGEFTRNSADVKVFSGGAVRNMSDITPSSEVFTWTNDHDADGNELLNFAGLDSDATNLPASGKIRLGNNELASWVKTDNVSIVSLGLRTTDLLGITGGNLTLTGNNIVDINELEGRLSNPLSINVPTSGQVLNLQFVGSTEWTFSSSTLGGSNIVLDNSLIINDGSAFPVSIGEISRNGNILGMEFDEVTIRRDTTVATETATLSLVKIDGGPAAGDSIGRLKFENLDGGTTVEYGEIRVRITNETDAAQMNFEVRADNVLDVGMQLEGDDNNRRYMLLFGGITDGNRIQSSSGVMGYFVTPQVTDFSLNIGTGGSLEIPVLTDGSPNNAALNSAFGAFDGAMGYETVDNRLYIREGNLDWSFWTRDGSVVA